MATVKRLCIPAKLLQDGDTIITSGRYRGRLRGVVKVMSRANGMVFLESPTLKDEDVAFRDGDTLEVNRKAAP